MNQKENDSLWAAAAILSLHGYADLAKTVRKVAREEKAMFEGPKVRRGPTFEGRSRK